MDVTDPETLRGHADAGAANSWGQRLRTFRRARLGLSRGDFAELINDRARRDSVNVACSERHVARWELGEVRRPSKSYRALLAALGAPVPEIDAVLSSSDLNIGFARDVVSRSPEFPGAGSRRGADATLLEALATAVVGSADILTPWLPSLDASESLCDTRQLDLDTVRSATAGLRERDQRHGGGSIARTAVDLLKSTTALLAGHRGHTTLAHTLLVATADLARLIGWAYHDIGDQHRARQYATMALVSARRAGADSLVASTLYVLGRISLIERDPRAALRMFQLGQLPAQDAGGGESARLYANAAWAHAMMGDAGRMRTALARAEDETARVADPIDPWTRVFFTPGEFTGMRSVIYNEYALTARGQTAEHFTAEAVDAARASLAASTPGRPARSILFDNITVATGAFRLGQIDEGVSFATASLDMTGQVDSGRVGDRLGQLVHAATLASSRSDVRDLCQAIRRTVRARHTPSPMTEHRLATA
ncbi:helix-turn-helix domain-containing protein [Nocardia sp. A7]|uniref:helix-turn-helix domain-containing protein n=1 Tax=Nocardia sp. A7 TaxID=2789274 RepID=UPI00397CC492